MFRGWVCALGLAAMLAGGGCSQEGFLDVTWDFQGTEAASSGCGQHGVDSIQITGMDTGGDTTWHVGLCAPGQALIGVKPGTWSVSVAMLNAQGITMEAPSQSDGYGNTGTAQVTSDVPGAVAVHLTPVPACQDGVDNNRNGRVDLDDPGCNNDPNGASE